MANELVPAWNTRCLVAAEASWGVTPNPASSQALEIVDVDTGPAGEQGNKRPKQDRAVGRGSHTANVTGHTKPIPFSVDVAIKSRAAVDTTPDVNPLYLNAGLAKTTNAGTSVVYAPSATPAESSVVTGLSLYRLMGDATYAYLAEQLRGGVITGINWSGGNHEVMAKFTGEAIGKETLGYIDSTTLSDDSGTTLTTSADEGDRIAKGWYQIESEIIKVTTANKGSTSHTIARGALSSTPAAHSSKALSPYMPSISFSGSPLSEAYSTVTIGGIAHRCISWEIDYKTGIALRPPETGSAYIQGFKVMRYSLTGKVRLELAKEYVSLFGATTSGANKAITIVQSNNSAVGSIGTWSMPYCEIEQFPVPATAQDVAVVDVSWTCKDSSGNDMISLTLT